MLSRFFILLNKLTMAFVRCSLIGICGSVGSGKSSLMSTILGQLQIEEGSLGLDGSIAYVPQQAWIFHDTARENIVFGMPWDEAKYNKGNLGCSCISRRV